MTRSWVNTVSLEHVLRGVEGGFTQADHGRNNRLRQLSPGDLITFYSPRTAMGSGEPLQQFTALGTVVGAEARQVEVSPDFRPWRLDVDFEQVAPAPVRPLLERLSFVPDPLHWGMPFRRGLFEIPEADMEVIAAALRSG